MKKSLIITLIITGLLVCGFIFYARANAQYPEIHPNGEDGLFRAAYPFEDGRIDFGNGLIFRIDTGSAISTINDADLELLKQRGLAVDSTRFPSIGLNYSNEFYVDMRRYLISLPVNQMKSVTDTLGRTIGYTTVKHNVSTIDNLLFLHASPHMESTIGSDILEKFVLQFDYAHGMLIFLDHVPDGFLPLTDMWSVFSFGEMLGCGGRYYMNIVVNNSDNSFFLDTSFDRAAIKLPESDTIMANERLHPTLISSARGTFRAKYLPEAWVCIGNRAGSHSVFYGNDGEESYSFNPFNFFSQDVALDFKNKRIMLRPTSDALTRKEIAEPHASDSAVADL